ncbi:MAG: Rpn family recombination-promoting nuclease/putative transposase, partial [Candidatus Omnitrophota bacterium]
EYKEFFSDVVIKTNIKTGKEKIPTDIYFLLEHKTRGEDKIFVQILHYMSMEWQKDVSQNNPLRIILPLVFYHGPDNWNVNPSFVDEFDVDDDLKKFMLNFRYILFDTNKWNFLEECNEGLKNNVYLFTSLVLMKCAFNNDLESIKEIFKFWQRKGFIKETGKIIFFLRYISATQDIEPGKLITMLEESQIDGGDIMQTLAQRWIEDGKKEGKKEGIEIGIMKTAKELLKRGFDIETIKEVTGFSKEKIEKLATGH